jgi:hypothetical protein
MNSIVESPVQESPLTAALRAIVASLYPSFVFDEAARFKPMLDLSRGDISSSIAIQIARITRGSALDIAEQLASGMPFIPNARWGCEQGYLILSRAPLRLLCDEAEALRQHALAAAGNDSPVVVTCLVPDLTVPLYAQLRLIACAAFQAACALCLGQRCIVHFSPLQPEMAVASLARLAELVKVVVCAVVQGEERTAPSEEPEAGLRGTIWTAHHYYDRFPQRSKQYFSAERVAGRLSLKMPPDGWLLARERGLSDLLLPSAIAAVVEKLTDTEGWLRWIFHGASSIPSGDYDPSVVLYEECASVRWSLLALQDRFESVIGERPLGGAPVLEALDLPEEDLFQHRHLLLRAIFLPAWLELAAQDGGVLEALTVLEEFAREGHAFLNSPSTRLCLNTGAGTGAPDGGERGGGGDIVQIVAGLQFGISSMLTAMHR